MHIGEVKLYVDCLCHLPEVGEHILSRGEEQRPSLPVQSQSEELQPPKNKVTTQIMPPHLKT